MGSRERGKIVQMLFHVSPVKYLENLILQLANIFIFPCILKEPVLRAPTPIKYNATVVPAANFKVVEDVEKVKESLSTYVVFLLFVSRHRARA